MPVYVSKKLKELYLMQFPLHSSRFSYDEDRIAKSKIKPMNQEIELEVSLDTSANYNKSKAEMIASNAKSNSKKVGDQESHFMEGYFVFLLVHIIVYVYCNHNNYIPEMQWTK